MNKALFNILPLLMLMSPTGFAEIKNHSDSSSTGIRPKDTGSTELKIPAGLGLDEVDVQCRKANILRGLQEASRRASEAKDEIKNLEKWDKMPDQLEAELRRACLKAQVAAHEAKRTGNYLAERGRSGEGKEIKSDSTHYKAAVTSKRSKAVEDICRRIVGESSQLKPTGITDAANELTQALEALIDESNDRFAKAKGSQSILESSFKEERNKKNLFPPKN